MNPLYGTTRLAQISAEEATKAYQRSSHESLAKGFVIGAEAGVTVGAFIGGAIGGLALGAVGGAAGASIGVVWGADDAKRASTKASQDVFEQADCSSRPRTKSP